MFPSLSSNEYTLNLKGRQTFLQRPNHWSSQILVRFQIPNSRDQRLNNYVVRLSMLNLTWFSSLLPFLIFKGEWSVLLESNLHVSHIEWSVLHEFVWHNFSFLFLLNSCLTTSEIESLPFSMRSAIYNKYKRQHFVRATFSFLNRNWQLLLYCCKSFL